MRKRRESYFSENVAVTKILLEFYYRREKLNSDGKPKLNKEYWFLRTDNYS